MRTAGTAIVVVRIARRYIIKGRGDLKGLKLVWAVDNRVTSRGTGGKVDSQGQH